jgi:hypothetical protein
MNRHERRKAKVFKRVFMDLNELKQMATGWVVSQGVV